VATTESGEKLKMWNSTVVFESLQAPFLVARQSTVPGRAGLTWIVLIVLSYLLAGTIVSSPSFPILLLLSLLFFVVALKNECHGYIIAMVLAFYSSYLVYILSLGSMYLMLPYMLVLALVAGRFTDPLRHVRIIKSPLNSTILVLIIFAFISLGLKKKSVHAAVKGLVKHLTFVLMFFIVVNSKLTEASLKTIIRGFAVIASGQIVASIIQFYFIYADYPTGARQDLSAGLFGFSSGDINAVFMTFMLSLVFGFILEGGAKFSYLLGAGTLAIPIILSSARAGLIFFVTTTVFLSIVGAVVRKRKRLQTVCVSVVGVGVIIGGVLLLAKREQISFVTNPSEIYGYSIRRASGGLGRLQALGFVHNSIGKNIIKSIVGYGPGAITPTRFLGRNENDFYQNSDVLSNYNDYAYVALELGYAGLLIHLYVLYRLLIFSMRFYSRCPDKFWRSVSLGLVGIIFTSVYAILYTRGWTQPPLAFPLWFIAGAVTRIAYLRGLGTDGKVSSVARLANLAR
jgi:hypothetical protein